MSLASIIVEAYRRDKDSIVPHLQKVSTMQEFEHAASRYGAQMGRKESREGSEFPARCFKVKLDNGGYDSGAAYWGFPNNLYCAKNAQGLQDLWGNSFRKTLKPFRSYGL